MKFRAATVPPFRHALGDPPMGADPLSEAGAYQMAAQIRRAWAALGLTVETRVEPVLFKKGTESVFLFQVRSNLVDGVPPGAGR